ncbi:hypothetical protein M3667_13670 [Microbacterium sp. P26]|uniref:hypothetical protein n=1 Tax=Microbacterium TaxID=33882 RepID=UPI00203D42E1|nr:hypothetical protein [Microbacterium sp. P26]MCM3502919.1 hypothetical protein [Microbacterium sp. P26]
MNAHEQDSWIALPTPVAYDALVDPPHRDPKLKPDAQAVSAFAAANGWQYFVGAGSQPFPGVVFRDDRGRSRQLQRAGDIVRVPGPAALEIGNSASSFTVNLNQFSVEWGYAAVRLPFATPGLIVETARARAETPLPALPGVSPSPIAGRPDAGSVYVAPEHAAWAAAVVTPELGALLTDDLAFDLEIVDGWLFLYHPGRLSVPDPAVWQRVFAVLEVVGRSLATAAPALPALPAAASPAAGDGVAASAVPAAPAPERGATSGAGLPVRDRSSDVTRTTNWTYYGIAGGVFVVLAATAFLFVGR